MEERRVAVLVVGAGLGGLSATMFLARHGVDVLTVDRHPGTAIHPRATGQNPRTMELLRWAGIDEAVLTASPMASKGLTVTVAESLVGPVLHRIVDDANEMDFSGATSMPFGMASQDVVEPIMLARAEKSGAEVRFLTELVSFEQDDDGVTAQLRHRETGEETTVRARYLVAADGGRSKIRAALGIGTDREAALSHCLGAVFDADLQGRLRSDVTELFYLPNPERSAAILNTAVESRYVYAPDYFPAKGESPDDFTPARLTELIRAATGLPELVPDFQWTGAWEVAARVADRFRSGRVFLVGDAAKVTPPTGGMGGNTAVGDGHDLAWKLAAVLRGDAGPALLDTYEAERRPIARMVVDTSLHNMKERMNPELDVSGLTPAVEPFDLILGFRYRSTAVLAEDDDPARAENPFTPSGRPGFRAPDVSLGASTSTVDLLGRSWVLLCADDGTAWAPAAADISAEIGVRVECHVLCGEFGTRYGLKPGGASLVRPDGVVAWRAVEPVEDAAGTLRDVLGGVLSR